MTPKKDLKKILLFTFLHNNLTFNSSKNSVVKSSYFTNPFKNISFRKLPPIGYNFFQQKDSQNPATPPQEERTKQKQEDLQKDFEDFCRKDLGKDISEVFSAYTSGKSVTFQNMLKLTEMQKTINQLEKLPLEKEYAPKYQGWTLPWYIKELREQMKQKQEDLQKDFEDFCLEVCGRNHIGEIFLESKKDILFQPRVRIVEMKEIMNKLKSIQKEEEYQPRYKNCRIHDYILEQQMVQKDFDNSCIKKQI